jgi:hypothetical protein
LERSKLRPTQAKSYETLISTNKLSTVAHACHLSYAGGVSRWIVVQGQLWDKNVRPYPKKNFRKEDWGCGSSGREPT